MSMALLLLVLYHCIIVSQNSRSFIIQLGALILYKIECGNINKY